MPICDSISSILLSVCISFIYSIVTVVQENGPLLRAAAIFAAFCFIIWECQHIIKQTYTHTHTQSHT